jgi:hypothetical protein
MPPRWPLLVVMALLLAVLAAPARALAQDERAQASQTSGTGPQVRPPQGSANLDRIREAVTRPPALIIDDGRLKIYVEVIANWPNFAEMVKGYDLMHGPTKRGGPMSHQEFLNMVTPKEMHSSVGIRPTEILQAAIVGALGQAIIKRGLEAIRQARDEREIQEIRAQIDRELAALRGGK